MILVEILTCVVELAVKIVLCVYDDVCLGDSNPEQELKIVMEYEPKVDWSKVPVDTKILVRNYDDGNWIKRYFAKYENNIVYTWMNGSTSFSSDYNTLSSWDHAKLYKED